MNRSRLYGLMGAACLVGYAWLYFTMRLAAGFATSYTITPTPVSSTGVCLVKHVTSLPCPSCGSTRSVLTILQGDWWGALLLNPFGYLIAAVLVMMPFWILFDLLTKKSSLFIFYQKVERIISKPVYAIPLILLVLVNWAWNILKGL